MAERISTGIGFFGMLTLLFIYLKVTGEISCSPYWGLIPFSIAFLLE